MAVICLAPGTSRGCELCAIYGAASARGESGSGFVFTLSEQYVAMDTPQFESKPYTLNHDYVDSSYLHIVPTYNFSGRFGVSLNLPYIHREFRRQDVRFSSSGSTFAEVHGTESGIGDLAAVLRWTVLQKAEMEWGYSMTLLAGVKFPTGDTDPIRDEVDQVHIYNQLVGPGHFHDALGVGASGVHQSMISLGSGSYDGVFGLTANARWDRWFFNAQAQYYLRTAGESGYTFGDEVIISGGPGGYLWLSKTRTLSLAANIIYDSEARASLDGRKSNATGMTIVYAGPQLAFTSGRHFSMQAGVDVPVWIQNNGFQNVPDYRAYGGLTWRF
ncbi:MAG: hypothetical protein QOF48_1707 [Verrucomicrobiota bacterium]|jgi:hypothetical protein